MIILAIVTLILMVVFFLMYSIGQLKTVSEYGNDYYQEPSEMFSFDKSIDTTR